MVDVNIQTTIGPYKQEPVCTRPLATDEQLDTVIAEAVKAQKSWKKVPIEQRVEIAEKWVSEIEKQADLLAEDLSIQMGRPISQGKGEVNGTLYRARHSIKIAKQSLAPVPQTDTDDEKNKRTIIKQPLGVVVAITPWNYPHLCTVNTVVPALSAGNAVIIKPAPQTPVPAERVLEAFTEAGLPPNVSQVVHLSQESTSKGLVSDPRVDYVVFTGSVAGGRAVDEAAATGPGFKGVGLESGGKDPAYVRPDADSKYTVENLVDGAFFNSGQSCCGIERIYVHSAVYDEFVKQFVASTKEYKLGDPMDPSTTLGPVVSLASAKRIRAQIADALKKGAKALVSEADFPAAKEGTTLVGPTVLINVDHSMDIMVEETFGPAIGIMKVDSDQEALALMNDSAYGLTASVWTNGADPASTQVFHTFAEDLETGTVYMNRADALDPALPWAGVKDSGRGSSLSAMGYDHLTRAKSVMMRVRTD